MSPGGLNGSGVHPLPRLDEPRRKPKPRAALIASIVAALSGLGGGGMWIVNKAEARAEAVAIAKAEAKLESHDKELDRIDKALESHGNRIEDIAIWMGVPRDARKFAAENLGVQPMPAAVRPRPKSREPQ